MNTENNNSDEQSKQEEQLVTSLLQLRETPSLIPELQQNTSNSQEEDLEEGSNDMSRVGSENSAALMALVETEWISKEKNDQPIIDEALTEYMSFDNTEKLEQLLETQSYKSLCEKDSFELIDHCQAAADKLSAIQTSAEMKGIFNVTRHWMNIIEMTKEVLEKRKEKVEIASQHDANKLIHLINEVACQKLLQQQTPMAKVISGQRLFNQYFMIANVVLQAVCNIPEDEYTIENICRILSDLGMLKL
jgi:hypothetical protein